MMTATEKAQLFVKILQEDGVKVGQIAKRFSFNRQTLYSYAWGESLVSKAQTPTIQKMADAYDVLHRERYDPERVRVLQESLLKRLRSARAYTTDPSKDLRTAMTTLISLVKKDSAFVMDLLDGDKPKPGK